MSTGAIIGIVISVAALAAVGTAIVIYCYRRKPPSPGPSSEDKPNELHGIPKPQNGTEQGNNPISLNPEDLQSETNELDSNPASPNPRENIEAMELDVNQPASKLLSEPTRHSSVL